MKQACVLIVALAASASAQPADNKTLAEQLFDEGRELAKADNWAAACPKFEASLRYDAALGTRLNLATCYEKIGKVASAWGLYKEAAEAATKMGDTKRLDYAVAQAAALEPRLPKLKVVAAAHSPTGYAVTRDGTPIDAAALGENLYVDPGEHEIAASAPGFVAFSRKITVEENKTFTLTIPELLPKPDEPEPPGPGTPAPAPPASKRKLIGLVTAGGGVLLVGVGLVFGLEAHGSFDDAKTLCGADLACDSDADFARGKQLISDANSQATISTVFVSIGAAAIAAGAVVYLTAPSESPRVTPVMTAHSVGLAIGGRF
jgi:hypothetical protein